MDNTFTRTVPHYLKKEFPLEVVGNFRSRIADVRLDRQHKMIREILNKTCFEKKDISGLCTLKGDLYDYLDENIKEPYSGKTPEVSVLYTTARDAVKNEREIAFIKDELNIMGMPVKKWLIECDEQLFQVYEEENKCKCQNVVIHSVYALEPIINLDYCLELLKGICMLSGDIFSRQFYQYSELVNFIREEEKNTYKIKCAVRRLSLLLKAKGTCDYIIL